MNEFIVNEFLKLKLENGKTLIYVKDEMVLQCKYLLLNKLSITTDEINGNKQYITIDDQAENLDNSLEREEESEVEIPPEAEFWAHSSNLQAWYENNYDTEVLHSNLSFPLLRELTKAGDQLAKEVFEKEIKKRFRSGNLSIMTFLVKEGYLDHLSLEESEELYHELDFRIYKELQRRLREANTEKEGFCELLPLVANNHKISLGVCVS